MRAVHLHRRSGSPITSCSTTRPPAPSWPDLTIPACWRDCEMTLLWPCSHGRASTCTWNGSGTPIVSASGGSRSRPQARIRGPAWSVSSSPRWPRAGSSGLMIWPRSWRPLRSPLHPPARSRFGVTWLWPSASTGRTIRRHLSACGPRSPRGCPCMWQRPSTHCGSCLTTWSVPACRWPEATSISAASPLATSSTTPGPKHGLPPCDLPSRQSSRPQQAIRPPTRRCCGRRSRRHSSRRGASRTCIGSPRPCRTLPPSCRASSRTCTWRSFRTRRHPANRPRWSQAQFLGCGPTAAKTSTQ